MHGQFFDSQGLEHDNARGHGQRAPRIWVGVDVPAARSVPSEARRLSVAPGLISWLRATDKQAASGACMATNTSQLSSRYSSRMTTRWPSWRNRRPQRRAVMRLPLREPDGAGVTRIIFTNFGGISNESPPRHHVGPDGEKFLQGVSQQAATRGPAAAAQNFVGAEPGLGILFVRVGNETWIRQEWARGPFPNIADHLAAAGGAVSIRQAVHVDTTHGAPIKVCVPGRRDLVAPRKSGGYFAG